MSRNKTPAPPKRRRWIRMQHGWVPTGPRPKAEERGARWPLPWWRGVPARSPKPRRCAARGLCQSHWSLHSISEATFRVVVFHLRLRFHLYYTSDVAAQSQTGVKLNRVFFPRLALQVRSLDCRFAR
ncbi:unnamed protein product [Phytomonas sp. EM1]|nr:unnamed protein product [Phytomonas sp. EM1]|eukprot:CCW64556.1 unnamed protein product [Phytomonas sp. isolate EM1]